MFLLKKTRGSQGQRVIVIAGPSDIITEGKLCHRYSVVTVTSPAVKRFLKNHQ